MKIAEIRKLSEKELNDKIKKNKKELFDLRLKQATGGLEKPHQIKELRKDVAKMLTILKEREIEERNSVK